MHIRHTARLIVTDPDQRVLLFYINDSTPVHVDFPGMTVYWLTPGGGVDPGETHEQAAVRELWEETGIRVDAVGPCVWTGERRFQFPDRQMRMVERYFHVAVPATDVVFTNMLAYEHLTHVAHRWWTLSELQQTQEALLPPELPQIVARLPHGCI